MASDEYKKNKNKKPDTKSDTPKYKQLVQMLSFRVVPAYFKEIEKVANHKNMTVSKLIRTYVKEGMKRDNEISGSEDKEFRVD